MTVSTECKHCTGPADDGADVCAPVDSRTRPCCGTIGGHSRGCLSGNVPGLLADGILDAERGADTVGDLLHDLAPDAPLFAVVDLVAAQAHFRAAARLLTRAVVRIAASEAVR